MEEIWEYSAEQWGEAQADLYIEKIVGVFGDLACRPKLAVACDHVKPGYQLYLVNRHMVYFRITADGIAIMRVLHERMDAASRF